MYRSRVPISLTLSKNQVRPLGQASMHNLPRAVSPPSAVTKRPEMRERDRSRDVINMATKVDDKPIQLMRIDVPKVDGKDVSARLSALGRPVMYWKD